MKKTYIKPGMQVVELRQRHQLLAGSLDSTKGDFNFNETGDESELTGDGEGNYFGW